jgi:hypothetical protein
MFLRIIFISQFDLLEALSKTKDSNSARSYDTFEEMISLIDENKE